MGNELHKKIQKIIRVADAMNNFWSNSRGWAPDKASDLLKEARLDRQVAFAHTLVEYLEPISEQVYDAKVILGYATLRGMCESCIKRFLSAYIEDYLLDADIIVNKKGKAVLPKDIKFDKRIELYISKGDKAFLDYLRRVQSRCNAIHHFKSRDIGNQTELIEDIVCFKSFLIAVNDQLMYPDNVMDARDS
jgi:hypothetical protein